MGSERHQSASFPKNKPLPLEKSVGAIVIDPKGKYLLLDRFANKGVRIDGHWWEFPKGHQEGEESDMETLMREVWEECGIRSFEVLRDFQATYGYISSRGTRRRFVMYLIRLSGKRVALSEEHKAYRWASFKEAMRLMPSEPWKKILSKAQTRIKANF